MPLATYLEFPTRTKLCNHNSAMLPAFLTMAGYLSFFDMAAIYNKIPIEI
jgi:hypothetical protein